MAWTTPASYSVSEVLAAAKLNTHVRDNLRYVKGLDGSVTIDNALGVSGALSATGALFVAGGSLRVEGPGPWVWLKETDGGADAKNWRWIADNNVLGLQGVDDAESSSSGYAVSFTRSGTTIPAAVFTAQVQLASGSAGTPGLTFASATGEGMFLPTSGEIAFGTGFAERVRITATQLRLASGVSLVPGSGNLNVDAASGGAVVVGSTATDVHPATHGGPSMGTTGNRWSGLWTTAGAINSSSREVKQDIRPYPPAEAAALLRRTDFVRFRYRRHPELERVGFIAEDTDRTLSLDGKSAEPMTAASVVAAAWQEHDARLAALEALVKKETA